MTLVRRNSAGGPAYFGHARLWGSRICKNSGMDGPAEKFKTDQGHARKFHSNAKVSNIILFEE